MSEQSPYEKLGVTESASFEEIQEAKNRLTEECQNDKKTLESVETAYDAIIMDRLKLRQEGKIKVPDRIRFPERVIQAPPHPPTLAASSSPTWLKGLIDTPSPRDIWLPATGFLGLSGIAAFAQGNPASLLPLLLVFGVFTNVYFLNRKEHRFGRSLLLTFVGLLVGVGLGTGLANLLLSNNLSVPLSQEQVATLVTFSLFWLMSSFLR